MSGKKASTYDLGAARRKRGAGPKEVVVTAEDGSVDFQGAVFPEMPAETLDHGAEGHSALALRSLFVDPGDGDLFMSKFHPSIQDLADMLEQLYGAGGLGEALASGVSSTTSGTE